MEEQLAVLVAAGVAAVSSLITLVVSLISSRRAGIVVAYRNSIEGFLSALSDNIHQVVAIALTLGRTNTDVARKNWREKGTLPKQELKRLVRQVKYPLWGLSEHLQTLTRLPDWSDHIVAAGADFNSFDNSTRQYGAFIDKAIQQSYLKGRPPSARELRRLTAARAKVVTAFENARGVASTDPYEDP